MKKLIIIAAVAAFSLPAFAQKTDKLPEGTRAATGFTHQYTLTAADIRGLSGSTGTNLTNTIIAIGTNQAVEKIGWVIKTPMWSAAETNMNTNMTFSVGDAASATKFTGVYHFGSNNIAGTGPQWAGTTNASVTYLTSSNLNIYFGCLSGGSPAWSKVTNGQIRVFFRLVDYQGLR